MTSDLWEEIWDLRSEPEVLLWCFCYHRVFYSILTDVPGSLLHVRLRNILDQVGVSVFGFSSQLNTLSPEWTDSPEQSELRWVRCWFVPCVCRGKRWPSLPDPAGPRWATGSWWCSASWRLQVILKTQTHLNNDSATDRHNQWTTAGPVSVAPRSKSWSDVRLVDLHQIIPDLNTFYSSLQILFYFNSSLNFDDE